MNAASQLFALLAVSAQACWWLWHRERTAAMDDLVWLACVKPGETA